MIFENETNAKDLSLENICIVWYLRACEVVRLTDHRLVFAGWAAVKVACCVTKTEFTQSTFSIIIFFFLDVSCCMRVHSKNMYVFYMWF